jgi:hypothetical protein
MRLIRLLGLFAIITCILLLASCGSNGSRLQPEGQEPGQKHHRYDEHHGRHHYGDDSSDPDYYSPEEMKDLTAFNQKCNSLNQKLPEANVVYRPTEHMRRKSSQTIDAAITLRTQLPPQEILQGKEATARKVRVSCVVQAQLRAPEAEFEIQNRSWQPQSLLTSPTARWTWSVTPNQGGNHELRLAVKPVIALQDESGRSIPPGSQIEASELVRPISVDVSVPPDQWMEDKFDRATSFLVSVKGIVASLTGVIAAVGALLVALRWRRRMKPSSKSETPG